MLFQVILYHTTVTTVIIEHQELSVPNFITNHVSILIGISGLWMWYKWREGDQQIDDFVKKYYGSKTSYQDFAPLLRMEFFNATDVANTIAMSGAR